MACQTKSSEHSIVAINVKPENLHIVLEKVGRRVVKTANKGVRKSARKAVELLKRRTPTNTGRLKDSWEAKETFTGVRVENDAPYAGTVEFGARPHTVSAAGVASLREWAISKFPTADEKEINSIVWGTVNKLKSEGQAPTYFVTSSMEEIRAILGRRIKAELLKVRG